MTPRERAYLRAIKSLLEIRALDVIAETIDRIVLARELLTQLELEANERK